MLSFRVFVALHPRRYVSPLPRDLCVQRLTRACRGVGVYPEPPRRASDCSILFHFSFSKQLSTSNFQPSPVSTFSKSFICNIYAPPAQSVANKRLTATLNLLDATLTKKTGGGWRTPNDPLHPELGGE